MSKKVSPSQPSKARTSEEACAAIFKLFGDMPTLWIVYTLADGPKRFAEIEKLTGSNPVTLTNRLKKLTELKVLKRAEGKADRQSVTYSLDTLGQKIVPIIMDIEKLKKFV
jgi:DNA-binding HxlR family transcriptional regulator